MPGNVSEESSEPPKASDDKTPMQTNTDTNRNEEVDFHGQKRSNATHVSTTDGEARLFRKGKGKEARLAYMGHALAENRHGLIVEASLTQATGTAEREAANELIHAHAPGSTRRLTLGADKAYDTHAFVADCRAMCVTPHCGAERERPVLGHRCAHYPTPRLCPQPEDTQADREAFGWGKTIAGLARPMRHGEARMAHTFTFAMAPLRSDKTAKTPRRRMSHGLTATDWDILSQTGCRRNSFPSGQNVNSLLEDLRRVPPVVRADRMCRNIASRR